MKMSHPDSGLVVDVAESYADRYASQGWRPATPAAPKGNASLEEWRAFAIDQGMSEDDIEGQSRDDLRAALS